MKKKLKKRMLNVVYVRFVSLLAKKIFYQSVSLEKRLLDSNVALSLASIDKSVK